MSLAEEEGREWQAKPGSVSYECVLLRELEKQTNKILADYFFTDSRGGEQKNPEEQREHFFCVLDTHPELAKRNSQIYHDYLFPVAESQKNPSLFRKFLFSIFFVPAHIKTPQIRFFFFLSAYKLESIQRRARRNELQVLEGLTLKERLKELNMSSLAER